VYTIFWSEILKGRDHSEDLGVDGRILLEWILRETEWKCENWIHLAQDRNQWQALVNTVINLRVPQKARNFLTS
jgi:hypothetical protein